jgi:glycosyltransferase involved in cell wall biosynthesis
MSNRLKSTVKNKVLIIVENAPVPFDPRVWKEASSLRDNGYEVTVLCPRDKGYERGYEFLQGVHIYRHPMPKEGNGLFGYLMEYGCALYWQLFYAWWIYLRRGFHVIQGCNPPDNIFLIALPFRLFGVKYIFDHHDANPELYLSKYEKKGPLYKIQVWLERQTYRFSNVVIATNQSYRNLAITRGGIAAADVFVVRNGPDLNTFKLVPPISDLKHGKRFLVGYVGTMSIQEGLDILLDVALHIKNQGRRDVHFTCVGGGPGLAGLRKMVEEKEVGDMVNFTGRVSDKVLLEILSTADVCVNPDKPCEMNDISTMIKIMEYMALGKPIVQFDLKEGRFSAQEASLYASNQNRVADFAAKVLWLLDNPVLRQTMGQFGLKRVAEELAWEYSVPSLLSAYERAFSKRTGGWLPLWLRGLRRRVRKNHRGGVTGQGRSNTTMAFDGSNKTMLTTADSTQPQGQANRLLLDHFRCPGSLVDLQVAGQLSDEAGYFRLGSNVICYGQCSSGLPAPAFKNGLHDAAEHVSGDASSVYLPFDPCQVVDNLRCERYVSPLSQAKWLAPAGLVGRMYYGVRPILGVAVRRHLQRLYFRRAKKIPFPKWPVDRTVEEIFERLLIYSMTSQNTTQVPFIWFWPDGAPSCTMITHDVETSAGLAFCGALMDLNDSFGIKTSFHIIPENRYQASPEFLEDIRSRGFEIDVHDLNHDGFLMSDRDEFLRRAERINSYGRQFGARGFRSAVMYRNVDWYDALDFSYDMSVPNMAHLDPQQGGCCTIFPYFIGKILELPLTTTQDYSLFHILNDYSINLWKEQIALILEKNGLISFIVHPDYNINQKARNVYSQLLRYISAMRSEGQTWIALPGEIAAWWRLRSEMKLVSVAGAWRIEGQGSERARLAYAVLNQGKLSYVKA